MNNNLLSPNALGSFIGFCDKNYGTCVPKKIMNMFVLRQINAIFNMFAIWFISNYFKEHNIICENLKENK